MAETTVDPQLYPGWTNQAQTGDIESSATPYTGALSSLGDSNKDPQFVTGWTSQSGTGDDEQSPGLPISDITGNNVAGLGTNGYLAVSAVTDDVVSGGASIPLANSGKLYLVKVACLTSGTTSDVDFEVTSPTGSPSFTASENFVGLYSAAGTLLTGSASATTDFGTAGKYTLAWSTATSLNAGTTYYVGVLANFTGSSSALNLSGLPSTTTANVLNLNTGSYPRCSYFTGGTTLPSSVTLSGGTLDNVCFWVGLH